MFQRPEPINASPIDEVMYYDSIEGMISLEGIGGDGLVSVGEPETDLKGLFGNEEGLEKANQLYEAGLLYNFKRENGRAIDNLQRAYKIYLRNRGFLGAIQCLVDLGWLKYNHEPDGVGKSARMFSEALKLINVHMHEPGVNELRARLLHYQGLVKYREKDYAEGVRNFMYARTFCKPDGLEAARIMDSLAVHYERTNDYYRAVQCLDTAMGLKKENGHTYELAITCQILGRIYILKEQYAKACEHLQTALQISLELGDFKRSASLKNDLIRLHIYQNEIAEAEALIEENEHECVERVLDVPWGMAKFYRAFIHYSRREYAEAEEIVKEQIIPVFEQHQYKKGHAMALRLAACLLHQQGGEMSAVEQMSEVIAIFKAEGHMAELAKTYFELGRIYLSLNEHKLALSSMMEALKVAEEHGLYFLTSHIEDEIFRLDEAEWQRIVDRRARHENIFEKENNVMMDAISSLSETQTNESRSLVSLLRVAQAMAAERNLEKLLSLIKNETEQALNADRCTVFIYDRDSNELWSKIASGLDTTEEIRFPAHLGLAGYVVKTGEVLNIKDAYQDPRFNKEIDKKTGYHTRNILCIPMRNRNMEIVGVFQVLNKRESHFDEVDENLLTAIAANAGVAVENATLSLEMKISFDSFVKTLSTTIDARDPITAGHSERVADYSMLLGEQLQLPSGELEALKYASLLHDIGKIGIREDVLKKDGRLTEKEYRHIQKHVYYTHEILKNVHFERHLQLVPEIAASHHEKMDGSGYHRGLKGGEIHLSGRILAISDVFDAITSKRHYRNRMPFDKVLAILKRDSSTHFDPDCIESFFAVPLYKVARVLMADSSTNQASEADQVLIRKLDRHITMGEYYKLMSKTSMTQGEADIHRVFSTLYHQMETCDLD